MSTIVHSGQSRGRERRRPSAPVRRVGYAVAVALQLVVWYAAAIWPGWSALPFLTEQTTLVLPIFYASLAVTAAVNLVWLLRDPAWLTSLGNLLTAVVGIAVSVRLWQVFPFDFGESTVPWGLLARILLVMAIVGSAIGAVVSVVTLAVAASTPPD